VSEELELAIWDLFMIKGSVVLFRVALTLLHLMEADLMQTDDPCEMH
jgi:hypothetical protein